MKLPPIRSEDRGLYLKAHGAFNKICLELLTEEPKKEVTIFRAMAESLGVFLACISTPSGNPAHVDRRTVTMAIEEGIARGKLLLTNKSDQFLK